MCDGVFEYEKDDSFYRSGPTPYDAQQLHSRVDVRRRPIMKLAICDMKEEYITRRPQVIVIKVGGDDDVKTPAYFFRFSIWATGDNM